MPTSSDSAAAASDLEALSIIDDMDTAVAVLFIGRDHGITPQADACLCNVTVRCRDYLAARRKALGEIWNQARSSWIRPGPEIAPMAAALSEAVRLIEVLIADDKTAARKMRDNLRSGASVLHHLRAVLAKAES